MMRTILVRLAILMALAGALWTSGASSSFAQTPSAKRVAIVIGNSGYTFSPLTNPRNDAKLIATTFTELGFDVLLLQDIKKAMIPDLEATIKARVADADMAVVYYAGHAVQHEGQNLLMPVDVRTDSVKHVVDDSIKLNELINVVEDAPGIKLFILDACRNSPVADGKNLRSGLAYVEAGSGQVLIAFATSAGQAAYDGTGANSPYTAALSNALQTPGLDIYDTFRTVRGNVRQATEGTQIPWITGSIETRFVFRPGEQDSRPPETVDTLSLDQVLWTFIRNSPDPTDFERFTAAFPDSQYTKEAMNLGQQRKAELQKRGLIIGGTLENVSIADAGSAQLPGDTDAGEFVFQQGGQLAVSETFRLWPSKLPEAPGQFQALVTDCDLYAADPVDPQRVVPGISNGLVNIRDGIRACALALAKDPANARLQFQLGRVLEIARRYEWATLLYERSAAQNYSAALTNLGYMYRAGVGHDVDFAKALDYYVKASALGNLRARTNIGTAYMRGQGVPKMPEEGVLWYRLAASSGWANAVNALANAYSRGEGVKKDPPLAARLYGEAVSGGQLDAMMSLGRLYLSGEGVDTNIGKGMELLLAASDKGNRFAPFYAAQKILTGAEGLEKDPQRALSLFQLAAERGFENAYVDLAKGYRDGAFGAKPDLKQAYFNAVLADRFEAPDGKETKESFAKLLDAATRKQIEAQADLFVRQNGE